MAEALLSMELDDPVMFGPAQLVSSTKLVRNLSNYLDLAQKKPLFVARKEEVEAVILSIEEYRQLLSEEEKVKNLYHATAALRKLAEHFTSNEKALTTEELLSKLDLAMSDLAKG